MSSFVITRNHIESLFSKLNPSSAVLAVCNHVLEGRRITPEEAVILYEKGDAFLLGAVASRLKEKKHGDLAFYNRNFHIEPSNLCVFDCKFCSYARSFRERNTAETWELSEEDIIERINTCQDNLATEVHIVGGVHPRMNLEFYCALLRKIRALRPEIHVKAFTAVELEYMFRKAGVTVKEGLEMLKKSGLNSIPGGGAEIFDNGIRKKICADKASSAQWLEIHRTAHRLGIPSNATMLYGHLESYAHRADHLQQLRSLQDETGGFMAFIPLKFRNKNNDMSHLREVPVLEDLKNYAVSRIFLDNFPHIKAYWPMIGRSTARMALAFGVDDIDGTIADSTKIYSLAGAEEQNPSMTVEEITALIRSAGCRPAERDSLYRRIVQHSTEPAESVS